jgi:hypothetical protein
MKTKTPLQQIRSIAMTKANRLQRAHRHLARLRPAFAEWGAGEIYVCKKTGTFRYRFGELSKSITGWDALVREVFATPEAFAFAAMVLGAEKPLELPDRTVPAAKPATHTNRANVVALAA